MRYINKIIVHCTDTPARRDVSIEDVRKWHTSSPPLGRGWRNVGYHYLVRLDGSVERGMPISSAGIHCKGHNAHSIAVCYVGGRDADGKTADTRTDAQRAALLKLLATLTRMYRCKIYGHHDFNPAKACPCFDAQAEYRGLYEQLVLHVHTNS